MATGNQNLLIFKTLEHIINVTNVGLRLKEIGNDFVISYPVQGSNINFDIKSQGDLPKAELIFSQIQNNNLRVIHRFYNCDTAPAEEIIGVLPVENIQERIIFERVIEFLKKVKTKNLT